MESEREQDSRNLHRRRRRPTWRWSPLSLDSSSLLCLIVITLFSFLCASPQSVAAQHRGNLPPRFRTDANDASDQYSEIVVRVKEGASSLNREIFHLYGEDPDGDNLQFGVLGAIGRDILRIESVSKTEAKIFLKKELDREIQDSYTLVITLTDGKLGKGNYITKSLLLIVEDINDNAPIFRPFRTAVAVREDAKPGTVIETIEAFDSDEGRFGQVVYQLEEDGANEPNGLDTSQMFSIQTVEGRGVIRLSAPLDYERKSLYQIRVLAMDRALEDARKTSTAAIVVQVEDVDDQPPVFTSVPSVTRIPEDTPIGGQVLQITAIDGDRGVNNPIVYKMLNGGEGLFRIDSKTGIVTVAGKLDREGNSSPSAESRTSEGAAQTPTGASSYILEIQATEVGESSGFSAPSATTEVTIILTDVNDELPRFRQSGYTAEIVENSPVDMPVTFVATRTPKSSTSSSGETTTTFLQPQVYDHDQGTNGTFTLHLELDDDNTNSLTREQRHALNDAFYVTPSQGTNEATLSVRVRNPQVLDYERLKRVKLRLIAKEKTPSRGSQLRFSTAELVVTIKDANDNSPQFEREVYYGTVAENAVGGTLVASLKANDIDEAAFGTEGIRYTGIKGDIAAALELNAMTGQVKVRSNIDTSMYFDREQQQQHHLIVEARDGLGFGNRNTVQLVLNVTDVNDQAPRFLRSKYEFRIVENAKTFEPEAGVMAVDDDLSGSVNSRLIYSIVNSSSPWNANFGIDKNSGKLLIRKPLDFETISTNHDMAESRNITFFVRAQDHGKNPLWTDVPVTIIVLDQNDNAPVFTKSLYTKSIPEDVRDGSMVIQVTATDADASPSNSRVFYRLISGAGDKFVIDSNSGIISVAKGATLDPDKSLSIGTSKMSKRLWYLLKVMAIDSSFGTADQLSSIATVNVTIVDVNNKAPEFPELPEVFVSEDAAPNSFVTKILAYDPDDKPVLRYSFDYSRSEARNEFGVAVDLAQFAECFSIGPVDGVVRVAKALDREVWSELKLQVVVEDIAAITKGQKSRATFVVHITDVNDNRPQFTQKLYRAVVPENSIPGTSIMTAIAEDRDTNKSLVYSLDSARQPEYLKLVRVNSTTGELTVIGRIDRETHNWINVTVHAADTGFHKGGGESLFGSAEVAIQVLDENDNNPVFNDNNLHKVTIPEDTTVGTLVVQVGATDADIGAFGKLTYLLDPSSTMGKFKIDRETGAIIVADKLDREQMESYKLLVQAWDNYEYGFSTGESRKAFKTLTIVISDVNDETPTIISPGPGADCTMITEFHASNEPVVTLRAADGDDPKLPNGQITFEIINGNDDNLFEFAMGEKIPENSAIIKTRGSMRGKVGNYSLLMKVIDAGTPPRSSIGPIKICVTDVNDHNPIFVKPPSNMTIRIAENATLGTKVVDVLALDSDSGANAEVRYRLRELPNGHWRSFVIDPVSGVISLAKALDRETLRIHELRVQAYDLGKPTSLSTDMDITVLVTNIDDFEPEFTQDIFQVVFTENTEPGKERYKLLPTIDKDDFDLNDPNAAFKSIPCYFIVGGDGLDSETGEDLFKLDTFTHELIATKTLDREKKANYTLIVQATNDCFKVPPRVDRFDAKDNSMLQVLVGIRDVNDNSPKFTKRIFSGGFTTDTDYGTVFMSVKAIDPDVGTNSVVSYHIVSEVRRSLSEGLEKMPDRPFSINRVNGEIALAFDPQKGMKGYFEFDIKANDSQGLFDTAKVFIYLLREDQRVRFVLRLTPQELRNKLDKFQDVLANITNAIVNVDSYRFHESVDGLVDQKKTDLYLHFVNRADNSIMEVNSVLLLIDKNIEYLDELYKEFNVLMSEPTSMSAEHYMEWEDQLKAGLAGTSAFLLLLLILVVALCYNQKSRFERQLKAATVPIFGHEPQLSRSNVPNTNQHATEGSNPMWMTGYDNQWYKDEEQLSESSASSATSSGSGNNSLDENAVSNNREVDEHLHFSSLDTMGHDDQLAMRSDSSGNSSSSTTNDRSALCRASQSTIGGAIAGGLTVHNNFGTQKRPQNQPPPVPATTLGSSTLVNKKGLAPAPPVSNIVVISNAGSTTKVDKFSTLQRQTQSNLPKGGVNNIYIETFSNHHKSQSNPVKPVGLTPNPNAIYSTVQHNRHAHTHAHHHHPPQQQQQPSSQGGVTTNGHYHHHHHHPPTQTYQGSTLHYHAHPSSGSGASVHHHQLMNLETTEL